MHLLALMRNLKLNIMRIILISSVLSLFFLIGWQADAKAGNEEITVKNIAKSWKLVKYIYQGESAPLPEEEKKDYTIFKSDMTFKMLSEGKPYTGKWRLDANKKRIYLFRTGEEGEYAVIIDTLTTDQLIIIIDDPSDDFAKDLKIVYQLNR